MTTPLSASLDRTLLPAPRAITEEPQSALIPGWSAGWVLAARILPALVLIASLLILVGWSMGIQWLKAAPPGTLVIKVNTALAIALLAGAFLLAPGVGRAGEHRSRSLWASRALATLALAIGAITLLESILGWSGGIDNLLVAEAPGAVQTLAPGRMANETALSIVALSVVALVQDRRGFASGVAWITGLSFVALVTGSALLSHAFGAGGASVIPGVTPMSVAAGILMLTLTVAASAIRPGSYLLGILGRTGSIGRLLRRAVPTTLFILVAIGALVTISQAYAWWAFPVATATRTSLEMGLVLAIFAILGSIGQAAERRERAESAHAERVRDEGKRLLDAAQRIAKTGGWSLDVATGAVAWTEETYRIHEVDRATFDPSDPTSNLGFYMPEDRQRLGAALAKAMATGESYDLELGLKTGRGAHRWVRTMGEAVRQGDRIVRIEGNIIDVSERRRSENALRESELRYRFLAENISDLVVAASADGRWEYVSPSVREVLGYEPQDLVGIRTPEIVHPDDVQALLAVRSKVVAEATPTHFQFRFRRKDGSYVWVEARTTPVKDSKGRVESLVSIVRDITSQRAAAETRERQNDLLEARVKERTAELERANEELETFAYSVSHDLRAPLRAIDGFSHALLDDYKDKLDAEGKDNLQRVRAATQRMGALIDDILKLSRVGRAQLKYERVDLSAMAREIANELQAERPARDVTFQIQPGLTARGDAALLRIVLQNFLDNAWKFTSKHPRAAITFSQEKTAEGETYLVRDDGAGFDPHRAEKLFGAFQRLHGTAEFPGHGIGLATVRRIVARHGGKTWAEAEVEHGATFYFTLGEAVRSPQGVISA